MPRTFTSSRTRAFTIGELSRRTGTGIDAIRYYERIGLLPPPPRSGGHHRLYGPADVKRLSFIRKARDLGFPLLDIRTLLVLAGTPSNMCGNVRTVALDHVGRIRRKIADLRKIERQLAALAARCEPDKPDRCPLLDAFRCGRGDAGDAPA